MSEKAAVNGQKNFVEKISTFEKIAYGGGDLASNFVLVLTGTFVTFFLYGCTGPECGHRRCNYDVFQTRGRIYRYHHGIYHG